MNVGTGAPGVFTEEPPEAATHPGTPVRLLDLHDTAPVRHRGPALIEELARSGLRGRGGAAFPAARKWLAVAAGSGPRVVVANGAEGEPASWKDRWLMRRRPGLVLDGLLLAAEALGADRAIVYVGRREDGAAFRTAGVEVVLVEDRYVAGEETAVVRGIDEGLPLPRAKPPRPFEAGVGGRPTLVQNVETLAHAAWIARHGADAFREAGTGTSPGTALVTVNRDGRTLLSEVALGTRTAEVVGTARAVLCGGYFGGIQPPSILDVPLDYDAYAAAGSGLGCAAFTVTDDPLALGRAVAAYFAAESSRQCGVCLNGTRAMAETLAADPVDVEKLSRWATTLPGRGACSLLDGACLLIRSLLKGFPP
ncbi:NADH-ubiquinone oxidoreductase-F iron-sulfur binding region domain-containing protein [Streptosporangium sp. NPDC051022]|uniref:NADH-ubiquinone oxidoreductase-F iron-sulfur binding region domain-containing protein n=1 Tax=Streptosporangium sp. NPDC051022 TaxID=3155752 RepID=UPI00344444E3